MSTRTLWYGRDRMGRRSLLAARGHDGDGDGVLLSSVSASEEAQAESSGQTIASAENQCPWSEVATSGIFSITLQYEPDAPSRGQPIPEVVLNSTSFSSPSSDTIEHTPPCITATVQHHPWPHVQMTHSLPPMLPSWLHAPPQSCEVLPSPRQETVGTLPPAPDKSAYQEVLAQFSRCLGDAVKRRVTTICQPTSQSPRVGILFSGGIDCTVLAALTHQFLPAGNILGLCTGCYVCHLLPAWMIVHGDCEWWIATSRALTVVIFLRRAH